MQQDPTVRWQRSSLGEALVENIGIALIGLVVGGIPMLCGLVFWIAAIVDGGTRAGQIRLRGAASWTVPSPEPRQ